MEKILYDLASPQKSIWLTEQYYYGTNINNICGTAIIKNTLNFDILKKAINIVIQSNDSFKLNFKKEKNKLKQYVDELRDIDIEIVDLNSKSDVLNLEKKMLSHVFQITSEHLFEFKIFRFQDGSGGFMLNIHHLIADGWTLGLTCKKIVSTYSLLSNNLNEEDISSSYINYLNTEKNYLNSKKYIADKEYWQKIYSTTPEIVSVPGSINNANNFNSKALRKEFILSKELINSLKNYCTKNKISIYNFFMATLAIYMSKINKAYDFVIGTPILNRTNFEEKNTTGMFVNVCPFRINVDMEKSFSEFVYEISKNSRDMLKHQKYSYNNILEDIRKTNSSIPSLYNIVLSYQVTKANNVSDLNYETRWAFNGNCNEDIEIQIYDLDETGTLTLSFDYRENKYTKENIEDLYNTLSNIINVILKNEDIKINDISLLSKEEEDKILHALDNTSVNYPKDKTIVDLFEEQVRKTPNNIAITFENKQFTYKELNEKVNSLARYLKNFGVKARDIVAIRIDKSLEMMLGILAIIKLGCCYLPINMQYPKERVLFMLNDSKAKLLLGTPNSLNEFELDIKKIDISLSQKELYNNKDIKNLNIKISPEDLIYIIYTSGTTGTPKGAMLCHKNVVRLMKNDNFLFDFNEKDVWPLFHSVAFDVSVWEMYGALLFGGKLVIVSDNVSKDPGLFLKLIDEEQVTVLCQTPTYFYNLSNCEVKAVHPNLKVRYIIFAGEALKTNLLLPWHKAHPNTKLINMYGITETTVHATFKELSESDLHKTSSDIGIPLPTLKFLLLDENLKLVPYGVPGEICVCGDGVFKGYLNRPDLVAKKLVPNPYNKNELIYRSADSAVLNPDNTLEYLGRIDTQVKIRGFRIELGEIEEKISSYPNITSCIVTTKQGTSTHDLLCAYYISSSSINVSDLRKSLLKDLPDYMIPQYFIEVEKWPHNVNGKIDKKQLPEPQIQNTKTNIILPRNDIDSKLIDSLKELLNVDSISIDDSFFELGGDSLSAINFCVQIQNEFNVQLFVKDILEHPIIQDLSDIIKNHSNTEKSIIKPVSNAEFYPISYAQKRIYFSSKLAGNSSTLYNIPGGIILSSHVDTEKLEKCFKTLINRHESLRTYFELNDGNVVQKIKDNIDFKLEILNDAEFESIYDIFKNFVKPFDLTKAPLFRAKLVNYTNGKSSIFIDMHHIISDGTSLNIFTDELCKLYNDESLTKLTITYKDFSAFENERLVSGDLQDAENYWINKFEGEIPVLNLPTQYSRPAIQSFEGKKVYSVIDSDTVQKINKLSKELNITTYMILLSSYYILLSKYTSQDDIIVGSPIIGRDIPETYNIIGMFVNTLALRNHIDDTLSFKEFVLNIKDNLLQAYQYQTYPFDELVNKLNIKRDTSRNPLFDTMFIYQNNGYKNITFKDISSEYYTPETDVSKFDLSLEAIPANDEIKLSFEYATKLFKEEFIKNLSNHYINILNNILDNIDIKISDINMLSKEEEHKILYEFNDNKFECPKNKSICQLFEEQVEKTPDKIALVFEEKKLTYKELNEKANSVAHYLRNNGIGKNNLVGIMVNRSLEMLISIIAVIKSGGAYIPIDPAYPKDRISYMLDSSKAKILLTQKELKDSIDFDNKVFIDLDNDDIYSVGTENLENINTPEDLLYVIFTSGSTGKPKGVMLKQSNIINFVFSIAKKFDFSEKNTIASITTISFDIFIVESLMPLLNGLTVVIANEEAQTNVKLFNELCIKNNVDIIQSTPSRIQSFMLNKNDLDFIKNAKYIFISGEMFPSSLLNDLKEISDIKIYNMYGPTETAVWSTGKDLTNTNNINIGKPIPNTQIYILDKNLKPVPIGVIGELYIAGDGVSRGYLNNPKLTNEVFIKNPYLENSIMYKTGDIGTYSTIGDIICLGRCDNQIKIRGLRIETEEIESLILKHPHIKKAIVIKQTINNRDFLSAYFVANRRIIINEVRKYLSSFLPKYMIPTYFIALDDLPYTPNGKVDKKKLPLPSEILNISKEEYVAPKTELQKSLVQIWEKVLNTKPIGINDNFFELGGDSLLAMHLNVELQEISSKLTYSDIFRFPTIAELEEKINSNINKPLFNKIENLSDNYTQILKNCTKMKELKKWRPKNILLTGSTGFLGIHILEQFIKHEKGIIYCIVRNEPGLTARTKLYQKLNFYFGSKYDHLIDKRIFAITGDITKPGFGINQEDLLKLANTIDIVVHCAANVSHFGNYSDFYKTNVTSVKYIVDFCNSFSKKLYHVSTMSVSGRKLDSSYPLVGKKSQIIFDESCLYIGQNLDNVYTRSKFEAENYILTAISNGLDAYILRMGNLMPRFKDGVFQENFTDNAFINSLASFIKLGMIPDYLKDEILEFTPIDYVASATYKIITHPTNTNRIFHLYNQNYIPIAKCLKVLRKLNFKIDILPEKEFKENVSKILRDEESKNLLNALMNNLNSDLHLDYKTDIIIKSDFTIKYLKKLFFKWPKITNKYLIRFINLLKKVI